MIRFIVVLTLCLLLGGCSTPSATVTPVATNNRSLAFDVKMNGCWGMDSKCFGVNNLAIREASSSRTLWEVDLPGLLSGQVEYGLIPAPQDLNTYRPPYENSPKWPQRDNPGFRRPLELPIRTNLVATAAYRYDSPWPSAGVDSVFFSVESDGTILPQRPVPIQAKPNSEQDARGNGR